MKKYLFAVLIIICSALFAGCFITINNDFETHTAYFKNTSSKNIYLQYYLQDHNNLEEEYNLTYGLIIPLNTTATYAAPLNNDYLEKIIIVDSDTRKFMKKINGATYNSMLTVPEVLVENNTSGGKTTNYKYYFLITDEFLGIN
ncbi:MAG: hypothetical protein FWB86_03050 [Treponema sp.]|nr:hypothetical protein [Treponema sp.]MCL2251083.1 hypothetical protein [Treponema sp.]